MTGSLLRSDVSDGEVRLVMLETVRADALARLDSTGSSTTCGAGMRARFLERATAAEAELAGPDQAQWYERLEHELDNLQAALDWLLGAGRVADALRAISALERFWRAHAHVGEARRWLALALSLAYDVPADVRAAGQNGRPPSCCAE